MAPFIQIRNLLSVFHDILNKLAIADTNVEHSKLNRTISGFSALALHGLPGEVMLKELEITVWQPTATQMDVIVLDFNGMACGLTGNAELPISKMRELNLFSLTRGEHKLTIKIEREKEVPELTLTCQYGATRHRVLGISDATYTDVYEASAKQIFTPATGELEEFRKTGMVPELGMGYNEDLKTDPISEFTDAEEEIDPEA